MFREGPGRIVSGGFYQPAGWVTGHGGDLNLNRPGVVRAFVDEATRRGLLTDGGELDGWDLVETVAAAV